ncbi:putative sugar phosphate/phosphate translocator [Quercus suber]|uniref:Sugar phosphate/phosphate translocator n=1 Tax=Quercus suber TaxID=58331 RepID=A0AAW0KPL3_QUESU
MWNLTIVPSEKEAFNGGSKLSTDLGEEISSKLWVDTRFNTNIIIISDAAIAGVAAYNNHKLKKEASRASVDDSQANINESELAESEPLVASSASNK